MLVAVAAATLPRLLPSPFRPALSSLAVRVRQCAMRVQLCFRNWVLRQAAKLRVREMRTGLRATAIESQKQLVVQAARADRLQRANNAAQIHIDELERAAIDAASSLRRWVLKARQACSRSEGVTRMVFCRGRAGRVPGASCCELWGITATSRTSSVWTVVPRS